LYLRITDWLKLEFLQYQRWSVLSYITLQFNLNFFWALSVSMDRALREGRLWRTDGSAVRKDTEQRFANISTSHRLAAGGPPVSLSLLRTLQMWKQLKCLPGRRGGHGILLNNSPRSSEYTTNVRQGTTKCHHDLKVKSGRAVPVHTTTERRWSTSTAPFLLNRGARWTWVVNITTRRLHPWERTPAPFEKEVGRVLEPVWVFLEARKSVAPTGIKTLDRSARSTVVPMTLCTKNRFEIIIIIYQVVQRFHIFLRPFYNYITFFLHLPLSFQSSSINPFSPTSPLIPSAQVSLSLPRFLLPGGLHFITSSHQYT